MSAAKSKPVVLKLEVTPAMAGALRGLLETGLYGCAPALYGGTLESVALRLMEEGIERKLTAGLIPPPRTIFNPRQLALHAATHQ